jgi:hypothetical protein
MVRQDRVLGHQVAGMVFLQPCRNLAAPVELSTAAVSTATDDKNEESRAAVSMTTDAKISNNDTNPSRKTVPHIAGIREIAGTVPVYLDAMLLQ